MRKNPILAFAAVVVSSIYSFTPIPALAAPITYVYVQTSSSLPGFNPVGTITINGGFADLPTLTNLGNPAPYDFGNLLGFNISFNPSQSFSLLDFIERGTISGLPVWHISPGGLSYLSFESDFILTGGGVSFNTDRPGLCSRTGACFSSGNWVSTVPEPITLSLFGAGAFGAFAMRGRKGRKV